MHLLRQRSALGDGGGVGAVESEDAFEHVARLGDVIALGDDEDDVLVGAAGGGDVEASSGRLG